MTDIITFGEVEFGRPKAPVEVEKTTAADLEKTPVHRSKAKKALVGTARISGASRTKTPICVHSAVR
jgi:hypothetical protein